MPLLKLVMVVAFSGFISSGEKQGPVATKIDSSVKTNQTVFSYIRTHRQAKNVVINWGVSNVAGVDHFVVYHSEVGDIFDPLPASVQPDGTLKYTFKHESVFPGYHYYYIKAVMTNGTSVDSPVDVVRIVGH